MLVLRHPQAGPVVTWLSRPVANLAVFCVEFVVGLGEWLEARRAGR